MYKHILFPTDGSELALKALPHALGLARALGARVTGLHVVPEYYPPVYEDSGPFDPEIEARFEREAVGRAERFLSQVSEAATREGVPCETLICEEEAPHRAILSAVAEAGCDLIVLASHGRSSFATVLLGSETQKVLALATVPVLVIR